MKFSSLLNDELILYSETIDNYDDALRPLVEAIHKKYKTNVNTDAISEALASREKIGSTLFENGIAIPHARLENFKDLIVAIMVLKNPIKTDDKEIKIIFMVITSMASSQIYLNTLSSIAQISFNTELYNDLYNSTSPAEFINRLTVADIRVKKDLTVGDIMTKDVISVTPDITVKKLMDLFAVHARTYAPIVDENNRLLGEINLADIISLGIPEYATMVGDLGFLSSFEPFENLLIKENVILVGDVMRKPQIELSPDSSIIEMAFQLIRSHKRHASIVQDGKFVGVVSLVDIMNKMLRV